MTRRLLARKTLRELRSSRAQTLALVAVIALGVTVFVAAIGAYRDLATSEATTYDRLALADAWYGIEPASEGLIEEVKEQPGVQAVEGRLVVDTGLQVGADRVRARLIGTTVADRATVNDVVVVDGSRPTKAGDVLLERTFADRRNLGQGDSVQALIAGEPVSLSVAGTVSSPEYLQVTPDRYELLPAPSSFAVIFLERSHLQALTDRGGEINELVVRFDSTGRGSSSALEERLRDRVTVLEAMPRGDQASYAALEQDLGSFRAIAIAMPTIILLAGIAAMAVMLGRLVRAQRPLIGVMKAIGYSDRAVLGHYLSHALLIGVTGAAVGVVGGTLLAGGITRTYTGEVGVPFTSSTFHPGLASL